MQQNQAILIFYQDYFIRLKKPMVIIFFFLAIGLSSAQNNISGIINNYAAITSFGNPGFICILTPGSSSAFSPNQKVLIIQTQGADIDTSNTSSFGNILNIGSCGNYEFSRISAISGDSVILCSMPQKNYNCSGKVQLVSVPEYNNVTVSGSLTAQAWNGSTGGVLSFISNTLTLLAPIDVSGKGFNGGQSNYYGGVNCGQTGYVYPVTSTNGVDKGNGISILTPGLLRGRGAAANAGGGGNNHNAGGGGGGNYGAGGNGGMEWSGCGTPQANGGLGGYALSYSNQSNQVFMGGGGGAGHNNLNGTNTPGGAGGGIILITAQTIFANNSIITSAGANAPNPQLSYDEGRGGGGGGGAVLINAQNYNGVLQVNAEGGTGGNSNTTSAGPGGGGGGGVVWFSGLAVSSNVSANVAGGNAGALANSLNNGSTGGLSGGQLFDLLINEPFCAITASGHPKNETNFISVFPNPSSAKFTITINVQTESFLLVRNVFGEALIIKPFNVAETEINLANYPKGIYFLELNRPDGKTVKKIILE